MIPQLDETHDPALRSWVDSANGHADFPIQNLPLGVFSTDDAPRAGVAIGDSVLDLAALGQTGLTPFPALAAAERRALRRTLSRLLSDVQHRAALTPMLHPIAECRLHRPAAIGDYTDFYVGIHHANNIGALFRPDNPLLPNYKHVPIGYHGRASSVQVSGTPLHRPKGQTKAPDASAPQFGPTRRLDYELELGLWIGQGNDLGCPVPIGQAGGHIAGLCLLNDWSARDIQAWEYQPLGPFLAKNFLTTISPWIVTAEAIAPFRIAQPPRPAGDPAPLPYLLDTADQAHGALSLTLDVHLRTQRMRAANLAPFRLSTGSADQMYWTMAQLVAHHTSNGCNLNPGDLLGTGTISAPTRDGFGSLIELSKGGTQPIALPGGETRTFLEDGDELALSGRFHAEGAVSIGFGPCLGTVEP